MSRLPVVNGMQVVKALQQVGFEHLRTKGSHAILRNPDTSIGVTVPLHRPVKRGTLGGILRQVGITADEFIELL